MIREVSTEYFTESASVTQELMFLYDESGMIGFTHSRNGATPQAYYYHRNLQGDVVAIYNTSGTKVAGYAYDAWGNCIINYSVNGGIAQINPIRYRGYYWDSETKWYFLNARYYSPEWHRFISPDDTSYLDPESVNGLNLYCYCNNDPVNYADPSGHNPEWWQWLLFGIGVALVATAAIMVAVGTGGVYAFGMGALIGSASLSTIGAVVGGVIGYATGGTEGILGGVLVGFGIGAIVGFVAGGSISYYNYHQSILVKNYISQYGGDVNEVLATYKGKPKIKVLNKDTTVFRTWGGESGKFGHWISPKNYGSAARSKLSLPPWNTAENTSQFLISKGSIVISGKAAPLFGQVGGGIQWWIGLL